MSQNYPNPFNPSTTISFSIPEDKKGKITLDIFSIRGRHVRSLIDSELEIGNHMVVWDGSDDNGQNVSSGVYLYILRNGDSSISRKMTLLK